MRSFGSEIQRKCEKLQVHTLNVSPTVPMSVIPPWILPDATVDLTLLEKNRQKSNWFSVHKRIDSYYGYVKIYTDASKSSDGKVATAVSVPEFKFHKWEKNQ